MKISLRTFNNQLSLVVIGLGLYLIATPWIPNLQLWWDQRTKELPAYASNLIVSDDNNQQPEVVDRDPAPFPSENRIVIPSISLDSEIFSGNASVLSQGPWQRPNTNTPERGGNTVIAGHRFAYGSDGKWIFYHLDKIQPGERIGVYWEGVEYIYEVDDQSVVPPTAVEIEGPTDRDQLTLYTCTPLWTAENRLVVTARLVETNEAPV
ncbi:MAG: sortase [Patescibacteria group bacterium]